MSKEIQAFDILWENILEIDKVLSNLFFFDSILLESEYNLNKSYQILDDNNIGMRSVLEKTQNIESYKPYLSSELYEIFFLYRATFLRIHLKYLE